MGLELLGPARGQLGQAHHVVQLVQAGQPGLHVLGDVVQAHEELVNVVVVGRDIGVLNVQGPDEKVQVLQAVAEPGRPAQQLGAAPLYLELGQGALLARVQDTDVLGQMGLQKRVGLGTGTEVDPGNPRIQHQPVGRVARPQHHGGRGLGHRLLDQPGRQAHPPHRGQALLHFLDLGAVAPEQLGGALIMAPDARLGQDAQGGLVQGLYLVLVQPFVWFDQDSLPKGLGHGCLPCVVTFCGKIWCSAGSGGPGPPASRPS